MNYPGMYPAQRVGTRDDYVALAELSDRYGVAFEILAERFEARGLSIERIRERLEHAAKPHVERPAANDPDDTWMTTQQAQRLVPGLCTACSESGIAPRRKRRLPFARSATGTGWLWHRADVEGIRDIRNACRVSPRVALIAWKRLSLPLPSSDEWVTTGEASRMVAGFYSAAKLYPDAVERKRGGGRLTSWLWRRRDVLMAKRLTDGGIRASQALRILAAWGNAEIAKKPSAS